MRQIRVLTLPAQPLADTIYYVQDPLDPTTATQYVTGADGVLRQIKGLGIFDSGTVGVRGEYIRFDDGNMIAWRSSLNIANVNVPIGALFRSSSNTTWTFPLPFFTPPVVTSSFLTPDVWSGVSIAPNNTQVSIRAFSPISQPGPVTVSVIAIGKWR